MNKYQEKLAEAIFGNTFEKICDHPIFPNYVLAHGLAHKQLAKDIMKDIRKDIYKDVKMEKQDDK